MAQALRQISADTTLALGSIVSLGLPHRIALASIAWAPPKGIPCLHLAPPHLYSASCNNHTKIVVDVNMCRDMLQVPLQPIIDSITMQPL